MRISIPMLWTAMLTAVLLAIAGCSNTLETGYQYRPLNASATVRRGYYASPFSPEAKEAEADQAPEIHRPHPGM